MGGTSSKSYKKVENLKKVNLDSRQDIEDIIQSKGLKLYLES